MAKRKVNKSQAIRDYAEKNRGASSAEIVAALSKQGITVTAATVNTTRSKSGLTKKKGKATKATAVKKKPGRKKAKPGPKPGRKKSTAAKRSNVDHIDLNLLLDAKRFIAKAGSAADAEAAIRTLAKLDAI